MKKVLAFGLALSLLLGCMGMAVGQAEEPKPVSYTHLTLPTKA